MFLLLLTALMYPGDKIIFQKDEMRPIRQPGGYYSDFKPFTENLALVQPQGVPVPVAQKKPDKLSVSPSSSALRSCALMPHGWGGAGQLQAGHRAVSVSSRGRIQRCWCCSSGRLETT